jgi:SHS2 domain-containing protein
MTSRDHRLRPHTADVGLEATAPDLVGLFEELAYAIAGLSADVAPEALLDLEGAALPRPEPVVLRGADLPALAFAWLDELIGRVDVSGALVAVAVESVDEASPAPSDAGWTVRARIATLPFDGERVRRRTEVKAPTYHRLTVEPDPAGGWRATAVLDV